MIEWGSKIYWKHIFKILNNQVITDHTLWTIQKWSGLDGTRIIWIASTNLLPIPILKPLLFLPSLPKSSSLFNRPDRLLRCSSMLRNYLIWKIWRNYLCESTLFPVQTLLPHSSVTDLGVRVNVKSSPVMVKSSYDTFAKSGNFCLSIVQVVVESALTPTTSLIWCSYTCYMVPVVQQRAGVSCMIQPAIRPF